MSGKLMKKQQDVSDQRGLPVEIVADSQIVQDITAETVQLQFYSSGTLTNDSGEAAGTVVVGKLAQGGVLNALGEVMGTFNDTSLSFTSTALTTLREFPLAQAEIFDSQTGTAKADAITNGFANGEFCVDFRTGVVYGVKTSTTTTLTSTAYKIAATATSSGGVASDVNVAQLGGVAIDLGAGAVAGGTQRTTLGSDDPAVVSLAIMDDWDETNRAAVNLIVGQAGIAAGTGVDGVTVPRVTLATDIPLPAGTNAIGKLAANSGVDIGDVDVLSQDGVAVEGAALGNGMLLQGDDGTDRKNVNVDATTGNLQVDVVAALPAGTNAIGKLSANSGVDIGDVDVTSMPDVTQSTHDNLNANANLQVADTDVSATNGVPVTAETVSNFNTTVLATSAVIKASAGKAWEIRGHNDKASAQFIQVHDASSLPADTAVPEDVILVPANNNFSIVYERGKSFATGIVVTNSSTLATKTIGSADCWFSGEFE